ncbi:MAG: aldolase, partial [Acidimicrobiaceae bacterium]|nr:aldolase [Acidimicrobiaceae bacterium]
MRPNPVKDRLAAGETLYGTMIFEFLSAGLPQILQGAGADFVFYDMEHSGFSYSEIKHQLALCRGLDIVPLVRPRATTHEHTAQLLDLGAMGMLFQMCETAEQAEQFVRLTKYPPTGQRGAMFGGAHDDYSSSTVPEIIDGA